MKTYTMIAAVVVLLAASLANASVADSAANGFTVKITVNVQASPAEVYNKLIRNIGDWWNPAHSFSQNAHNLMIEEKAMGCWCEKLGDGGGVVRHMEVVSLMPGKLVRFSGALGPLQALAATGSMTFQFTPAEGGTKLDVTYAVGGYMPGGMNTLAPIVDTVLTEAVTRFKNYMEHGDPAFKAK